MHVSTGTLPPPADVQALLDAAHRRYREVDDGEVSLVYPSLAAADPDRFGLTVMGTDGASWSAGDATTPFTLMSVAKPFVFALLCEAVGAAEARALVGANATGLPFNSVTAVERSADGRTNPMVNAGALVTVGALPGRSTADRWQLVSDGLARFAGRRLLVDEAVHASAARSNARNRALAHLLHDVGVLPADPDETVALYTRTSCLSVTTADLAVMGAVLADGGRNPVTGEQVAGLTTCRSVLAAMTTAGLYEGSGDWLDDVGLPGKSGIAGGIVTVAPGKGALSTFSPRLDRFGNSLRGQLAARHLSRELGLDLFASAPAPSVVSRARRPVSPSAAGG